MTRFDRQKCGIIVIWKKLHEENFYKFFFVLKGVKSVKQNEHTITEKQVCDILQSYALTNSYNATAKECGCADHTVKKIVMGNYERFLEIKETTKQKFTEHAERLIYKTLDKIDKRLEDDNIPLNQLTTALGTLYDKRALALGETTQNTTIKVSMSEEVKDLSK